jgi:hypothetical protein
MASQKIVDGQVVGYQLDHTAQQVDDGITHAEELFAAALYTGGTLFGNANNHRNIYRGKYLGTSVTNDQKTAIVLNWNKIDILHIMKDILIVKVKKKK